MTTTAVVLAVAALAVVVVIVVLVASRRRDSGSVPDAELVQRMDEMRDEMRRRMEDLADSLERERRRYQLSGELGRTMDLEDIMERVLDEAMDIGTFEAALMIVEASSGVPSIRSRGLTEQEQARPPSAGVATLPGTVTVSYRYGGEREDAGLIRGGVFIPITGRELRPIGTLSLFWRSVRQEPSAEDIELAESLAEGAVPAIENARRYLETRELAETDALTGLYNQRFLFDTLRREVLRAQRYERKLAIMVFDLDEFKRINDTHGHPVGDRVIAQAADRLREAVRTVDTACRYGGDEFVVILPESSAEDAEQLYQRLREAMRGTVIGTDHERLRLSAGIAELRHGDTATSFFDRADTALYRAKAQGGDTVVVATSD